MRCGSLCGVILAAASLAASTPALAALTPVQIDAKLDDARRILPGDPGEVLRRMDALERDARQLAAPDQKLALAKIIAMRADAHFRSDAVVTAQAEVDQAMGMVGKTGTASVVRGNLLRLQGALQLQGGHASDALASYFAAYDVFRKLGDVRSQSVVKQWIASLYNKANDFERAKKYYREAEELQVDDPAMALSIHNNLGTIYMQSEDYASADLEYRRALALARQLKSASLETRILANLAFEQVEADKLDSAERSLADGFRASTAPEAHSWVPQLKAISARIAYSRHDLNKAAAMIDSAFAGVDTTQTGPEYRDAHGIAYAIYVARGDWRRALMHLEARKRLTDEATKVATTSSTQLMAAEFDSANQERQIEKLKAEEADRRARFLLVLFGSIGAAVAVIVTLLSFGVVTLRRSRNQVRAANSDLAQSNVALEKALKAKTEFLATTSHEIRTPLNGILGMTQVMLVDPTLPAAARDRINVVHGAGVTMRALVDDILDVAKIETGNLTVELAPTDLPATLNDVTRMWEEQARAKGLRFELDLADAPGWILSDAGRLRQIAFNLLSNAIKFTSEGGVTVRVSTMGKGEGSKGDARRLRIAITDSGIGIPDDKREVIFESFKQVDASTTRRFGGTGLGLTICRNLARALGGDIEVTSRLDVGSTFTIDLPFVAAAAPELPEALEQNALLLIERNPIARSMLRNLLEQRSVRVTFAASLAEARAAIAEDRFVQLLVDENAARADVPDPLSGLADLMMAARDAGTRVALLWSKLDDAQQQAQIDALGADLLLEKPIAGALLVERLFPGKAENHGSEAKRPLVSHVA